jgi:E3 ubiquitin-protein ligase RBBP6
MSSSILYKFKAATQFEALNLPGTSARLFDIKKAIVKAKRLDASPQDFDLSIKNAATNEEYVDEAMWIPRGTRVICSRLPAARGHGLLDRIANHNPGMMMGTAMQPGAVQSATHTTSAQSLYDIQSNDRDEDDDFVQTGDTELAALMAVTEATQQVASVSMGRGGGGRHAGSGAPPRGAGGGAGGYKPQHARPNADPELREQERGMLPKKRATGIPRTFLNLSAPPVADNPDGHDATPRLQPNAMGFEELKSRGGGKSALTGGMNDLETALKVTATVIPEHLQCAICFGIVRDAMLLPWDPEGRTTCETCIRDALTQNGFKCPLTGNEGVSPDDLLPNMGLRKAADHFVEGVMEKYNEVIREQPDELETDVYDSNIFEGDVAEKGVIVSRKTIHKSKHQEDEDPFGGNDDFGGDVFAVEAEEPAEEPVVVERKPIVTAPVVVPEKVVAHVEPPKEPEPPKEEEHAEARREARKQRAPPAGYAMGPAGQRPGPVVRASTPSAVPPVAPYGRDSSGGRGGYHDGSHGGTSSFRGGRGGRGGRYHQERGGRGDYDNGRGGGGGGEYHDERGVHVSSIVRFILLALV